MFRSLLVANRGEIACRVMRTARGMGIRTIAVYSDADRDARHVALADEAFRIGEAPPRASYLDIDAILRAARSAGADAIHPGYGFLSENATFAQACEQAGIVFVGPPASAIRAMGDKASAKALMQRAGVAVVPGYHGAEQDAAFLAREASAVGFPLLIKASAGGGGKGMRLVRAAGDFAAALAGAQGEAASAFGDARVLLERYLEKPRHIEIQVFADMHGRCISLFERDCSVQRRHQKVLEEAPAPGIAPAMRAAMGEAAVAAARAVGYVGAGTVEFIAEDGAFFFMEMNTRLQVEHPVTEEVTGLDLVAWQLRVAAGESLPPAPAAPRGHAIEARLYAENPANDYLPSVGRVRHLRLPDGVRVETGVRAGDAVTADYDPMLAKLIATGEDRATALRSLEAALAATEVAGVRTNAALLLAILRHEAFRDGGVDTGFLARHPELLAEPAAPPQEAVLAAAFAVLAEPVEDASPWSARDGWRLNLPAGRDLVLRHAEAESRLEAEPEGDGWNVRLDGEAHRLRGTLTDEAVSLDIDGRRLRVGMLREGGRVAILRDGRCHEFELADRLAAPDAAGEAGGHIASPIPGRVARVLVAEGDVVVRGTPVVVVEAMKMELTLVADRDGTITHLRCAAGEMVTEGVELVAIAD
ncbi:MAG: 3-methylcrotonyl-CoA carboxylase [Rhodospirillales bacterium]|nr:3-methylcrotonyl-CoA carboxylase [Rhodospirillales bacterium]